MKTIVLFARPGVEGEVVICFGTARLIRLAGGRFELRGGTPADHTAAKEWISLFLHEACPIIRP